MTKNEALKLALGYLEDYKYAEARTIIKEALAQPEQERNALPKAMNVVIAAMQADPGYAWSWHCNVAMAYVDEGVNRDVANQGAARFMKLLANVEPAHDILPTQTPDTKLNELEPVAFYVYKPTLPRGHLGNVSDGDLPWVYDQDPSSGYSARMLVYTTPPQRKPLDAGEISRLWKRHTNEDGPHHNPYDDDGLGFARAIEAAHGIKE